MLTIQTNMNFKSLTPICPKTDTFSEKIIGEYELMRADFEPEELLHLVMSSPDVYYSEGSVSNFITDNRFVTNPNIKLDVINNMINRIMFSGTVKPTYRDTVYIENVLRKLGVTDVKQFLKQVNMLENEDKATTKLLELYHDSLTELRTVAMAAGEEKKEKRGKKKKGEPEKQQETEPALYNEIFKRLDTAVIYSQLFNIHNPITRINEPVVSEQTQEAGEDKFSRNVLLSVFRNYVRNEQMPLTYRTYNIYEEGALGDTTNERTNVSNLISSAILLDHIEKTYRLYQKRVEGDRNEWFDYSRSLFGTGRDTIERIRERAFRGENVYTYDRNLLEVSNEQKTSELSVLTQLVHYIREEVGETGDTFISEGDRILTEGARQYIEKLGDTLAKKQTTVLTENIYNKLSVDARKYAGLTEGSVYTVNDMRSNRTDITEGDRVTYRSDRSNVREGDVREYYETDVDLTLSKTEEGDTNTSLEVTDVDSQTVNAYKQALDIINQQNIERITNLANQMPKDFKHAGEVRLDRSQAMLAADDILSGKSPLEMEYLKEARVIEKSEKVYENAAMNVMSEKTKKIMEVVHEYMENPIGAVSSGKLRPTDPGLLAAELTYVESTVPGEERREVSTETIPSVSEKVVTDLGTEKYSEVRTTQSEYETDNLNIVHKQERNIAEEIAGITNSLLGDERREIINETIPSVSEKVITDLGKKRFNDVRTSRSEYETDNVSLIHKQERNLDETREIVEELHRQNTVIKKTDEEVKNIVENINVSKTNISEQTTVNTEVINPDTVNRIITDRFRQDMDEISEKVYDRIERMLESERKRRGY